MTEQSKEEVRENLDPKIRHWRKQLTATTGLIERVRISYYLAFLQGARKVWLGEELPPEEENEDEQL